MVLCLADQALVGVQVINNGRQPGPGVGGHAGCGGPPGSGREGCQLSPVGLIFFSNLHRDTVMIMQARCTRDPRGWVGERGHP